MPLASDDSEIIPELSSPGMLMTDGCHGAAGITVIDSRLRLIRPPVAVLGSGCRSACTPLRLRATADLSKHTIVAGPCLAARIPAIAVGAGRAGAKCRPGLLRQPCGNKRTALRE